MSLKFVRAQGQESARWWLRTRRFIVSLALLATAGCSPLPALPANVSIGADAEVQSQVDEVDVVTETEAAGGGWEPASTRRFTPKVPNDWPLHLQLGSADVRTTFQITATARDTLGAVVALTRLIVDPRQGPTLLLSLYFDRECLRRSAPCGSGLTCSHGSCVDASRPLPPPPAAGDAGLLPDSSTPVPTATGEDIPIANAADGCKQAGARACAGYASGQPLQCDGMVWQLQPPCADGARCDTAAGSQHGQCRPIASECANQIPNVPFCDDQGVMRICTDLVASQVRPCAENEQCKNVDDSVRCDCVPGFVYEDAVCRQPTTCDNAGGCDLLTSCVMSNGTRVCGACPDGYAGSGDTGCVPLLLGLSVAGAQLDPAFSSSVRDYRVQVPLLPQPLTISASAPANVSLAYQGMSVPNGAPFMSAATSLGDTTLELDLTSRFDVHNAYNLTVRRVASQAQYLKAGNADNQDYFGALLAASADTLVVGAPYEDSCATGVNPAQTDNACANNGAVYVYTWDDAGGWQAPVYLKPSQAATNQLFGSSLALAGDTLVVGAIGFDLLHQGVATQHAGAVYVFSRTAGAWRQTARLAADGGGANGDGFGLSLGLLADTLVVAAPFESSSASESGAVYTFSRAADDWTSNGRLKAPLPIAGSRFGESVALSADTLVVGAPLDNSATGRTGVAYVFTRNGADWTLQQQLLASTPRTNQGFGFSMLMRGDELLIGAPFNDLDVTSSHGGAVYAFARNAGQWAASGTMFQATVPAAGDYFGTSLAATDSTLVIGASGDTSGSRTLPGDPDDTSAPNAGAAYVYGKQGRVWALTAYLKASNADMGDSFGAALTASDSMIAIGAAYEDAAKTSVAALPDDNSQLDTGAVYMFR
jgi:hypothetical protein